MACQCQPSRQLADARVSLERALGIFDPERDSELAFRFAQDLGVSITAYLALVLWPLGEVDRAREVAEEMVARASADRPAVRRARPAVLAATGFLFMRDLISAER
jgi:hypothetical protein